MFIVPVKFACWYSNGRSKESRTGLNAAKWNTMSGLAVFRAFRVDA